jgi:hypothetical protein
MLASTDVPAMPRAYGERTQRDQPGIRAEKATSPVANASYKWTYDMDEQFVKIWPESVPQLSAAGIRIQVNCAT